MTLNELIDRLEELRRTSHGYDPRGDMPVCISVTGCLSSHTCVEITSCGPGFDWTSGKIVLGSNEQAIMRHMSIADMREHVANHDKVYKRFEK